MGRYLIERIFVDNLDEEQLRTVGARSKELAAQQFPEILWEHSHVVTDADGNIKSYCVYTSPSEQMLRDHASLLGFHQLKAVYEIGGDISPADFPS
jgi:hypothetical protein